MTKDEFTRIFRMGQWPDFFRVTDDLRAVEIDFNYKKMRKALEPHWDPYKDGPNMDLVQDSCDVHDANLITSQHISDHRVHRIVLDLDQGAHLIGCPVGSRLTLSLGKCPVSEITESRLRGVLMKHHIPTGLCNVKWSPSGGGVLTLDTSKQLALIPSTTLGHHHLIMKVDMMWEQYAEFLHILAAAGIIENGYAKASIRKGWSAVRVPWVKKDRSVLMP